MTAMAMSPTPVPATRLSASMQPSAVVTVQVCWIRAKTPRAWAPAVLMLVPSMAMAMLPVPMSSGSTLPSASSAPLSPRWTAQTPWDSSPSPMMPSSSPVLMAPPFTTMEMPPPPGVVPPRRPGNCYRGCRTQWFCRYGWRRCPGRLRPRCGCRCRWRGCGCRRGPHGWRRCPGR